MDGYRVTSIDELPSSACLKKRVRYPPKDLPGVVTTEIGLWEIETNVGSVFNWLYWKSFFTTVPKVTYHIFLRQEDLQFKEKTHHEGDTDGPEPQTKSMTFILHKTEDYSESQTAFKQLKSTIEPLVDDCTLLLTPGLLMEIVLPQPVDPNNIAHHLTEVMTSKSYIHPDWFKVMRALMFSAIENDDAESVDSVFTTVNFKETDISGHTILHKTASSGAVKVWKRVAKKILAVRAFSNMKKKEGEALVQIAFRKNLPEVVTAVMSNLDIKLSKIKNEEGSTPFHLAAEACCEDVIDAAHPTRTSSLVEDTDFFITLNAINDLGLTPLMVAVQKRSVGTAVTLIQSGADLSIQHAKTGDTALHLAAKQGSPLLVKAIIAFRGNIYIKNKAGKTALEEAQESLSEDASSCVEILEETAQLMEEAELELSKSVNVRPLDPDSTVLLSLDGGGLRGLLTCQILISLHNRMKHLQSDCGPIHKYFDYLSGVSLGGLMVVSLVYINQDPQTIVTTFFRAASDLLSKCPNCPQEVADSFMLETMGSSQHLMMSDIQSPRVIIMTCKADKIPTELEIVCNYRQTSEKQWKAWEAGRATSAAPTYFAPHAKKYIDGGMMANNPTLESMAEIFEQGEREGKKIKMGMVVSIGTGIAPGVEVKDIDFFYPDTKHLTTSVFKLHNTIKGLTNVFNMVISQATRTDGPKVQQAAQWCKSLDASFFRFSPSLSEPFDNAETNKGKLAEIMYIGFLYSLRNAKQLDTVAKLLLSRPPRAL